MHVAATTRISRYLRADEEGGKAAKRSDYC